MCPNILFQCIQDILQSFRCSLNVTQTNQLFLKCSYWAPCRNIFGIPVNKSQNIISCYEQPHMDNMLILHSRCDQNVLSKNSLSTVNRSSQCSLNVITGFQVPSPPVSGRGSSVRSHPYVIALEGSHRGHAYRYSHQRNSDQSGGWGGEISDSITEGSGSGGSHSE